MRTFSPVSEMRKGRARISDAKCEKEIKRGEAQKIITFVSVIALATLIAVSLQLNGMLMMWKIQQATQDDAIRLKRSLQLAHVPDCSFFFRLLTLFHVARARVCNQARELILTNFLTVFSLVP